METEKIRCESDMSDHWAYDEDEDGPFIWKSGACPWDEPYGEPQSSFL